jgi:antirestriction protein ArdC
MNICESVTNPIVCQLEAGVVPWRKTWTVGLPKNLASARECRGLNLLVLSTAPFTSRYWLTQREALRHGGYVREGERATPVVHWTWPTPGERATTAATTAPAESATGAPLAGAVFNLDQVEGVPRPEDDLSGCRANRLEVAELMLTVMPDMPEIVHAVVAEPVYQPSTDTITLPHLSQLKTADQYYAGLFRALVSSTGAPHRLSRFTETGDVWAERSCFEALVAELGAAFLCGFAGISNAATQPHETGDLKTWSAGLRQDPYLLARAASAAQRAAEYIRGKLPAEEPEPLAGFRGRAGTGGGSRQYSCLIL